MRARTACPHDRLAIERLTKNARRALPRLWWWEEHLDDGPFVLVEQGTETAGAILAWPDDSPVAWVRLAAIEDMTDVRTWLDLSLPLVCRELRRRGTMRLAWMDYGGWAGPHLESRGFDQLTQVVTLAKSDRALPSINGSSARLRPIADADITTVAAVDREAFSPHWWQSEETIRRRARASSHFVLAEIGREVAGYVEAAAWLRAVHINRIAVHPARQRQGIGALLLHDTLLNFWRKGAERVTLNTQTDNQESQRLYARYGFEPSGERVIAWEIPIAQGGSNVRDTS